MTAMEKSQKVLPMVQKLLRYYEPAKLILVAHHGSDRKAVMRLEDVEEVMQTILDLLANSTDMVTIWTTSEKILVTFRNHVYEHGNYSGRIQVMDHTGISDPEVIDPRIAALRDEVFYDESGEYVGDGDYDMHRTITIPLSKVEVDGEVYEVVASEGVGFVRTTLRKYTPRVLNV